MVCHKKLPGHIRITLTRTSSINVHALEEVLMMLARCMPEEEARIIPAIRSCLARLEGKTAFERRQRQKFCCKSVCHLVFSNDGEPPSAVSPEPSRRLHASPFLGHIGPIPTCLAWMACVRPRPRSILISRAASNRKTYQMLLPTPWLLSPQSQRSKTATERRNKGKPAPRLSCRKARFPHRRRAGCRRDRPARVGGV